MSLKGTSKSNTVFAIAVVAILVVAACTVILLNNNNSNANGTMAPGTTFSYDVSGTLGYSGATYLISGTIDREISGQNSDSYFFSEDTFIELQYGSESTTLIDETDVVPEDKDTDVPSDAENIGTETIDVQGDSKKVSVWTYTEDSATQTDYVGSDDGILYKSVIEYSSTDIILTATLTSYHIITQQSYKESSDIGRASTYDVTGTELLEGSEMELSGHETVTIVGEDLEGNFCLETYTNMTIGGVEHDEYSYSMSNSSSIDGDTTYLGTTTMNTMDGELTLNVTELADTEGGVYTYYTDQDSGIAYFITYEDDSLEFEMTLTYRS